MSKSWAEKHPIITGALVGSIVPGIGTLAGALGGVIYDMTVSGDDDEEKSKSSDKPVIINKTTGKPVVPEENGRPGPPPAEPVE
jgi:hypothetical protein